MEFIHFFHHEIVEYILNINQSAFEGTGKQDLAYLERKNSQIKISQKASVTKSFTATQIKLSRFITLLIYQAINSKLSAVTTRTLALLATMWPITL